MATENYIKKPILIHFSHYPFFFLNHTSFHIMPYKISHNKRDSIKSLVLKQEPTSIIAQRVGVSKWTVNRMKNEIDPEYVRPTGGGRRIVPQRIMVTLKYKLRSGYLRNGRDAHKYLNSLGYSISYNGTIKLIHQTGLKAYIMKKRPYTKVDYMKDRLQYARKYHGWTVEQWKKVVFSDETKINMWQSDGAIYTWKEPGQRDLPHNTRMTKKFGGGSLMIWSCMTSRGVGYASQVLQKTMDSDCYIEILGTSFKDTLDYYGCNPDDVILQQDGDSKHTSKVTKKWLKANNIQYMNKWPPYSPDLNPIEHLWHHVKSKLGQYDTPPKTKQELFKRFETEWYKFTKADMEPYYNSLPKRIEQVLRAKGGYTRY